MTHQATANRRSVFSRRVSVVARIVFSNVIVATRYCFSDRRTDTVCDNNDLLFGRGLVGKKKMLLP